VFFVFDGGGLILGCYFVRCIGMSMYWKLLFEVVFGLVWLVRSVGLVGWVKVKCDYGWCSVFRLLSRYWGLNVILSFLFFSIVLSCLLVCVLLF